MDDFKSYVLKKNNVTEVKEPKGQWDVVLFCGDYDPITRNEYDRIEQFTTSVVRNPKYSSHFSDNVEYGLLVDIPNEDKTIKDPYSLTLPEREFISGRLFGLKMFGINYRQLMWMMLPISDNVKTPFYQKKFSANVDKIKEKYSLALESLKNHFENTNILIVIDPSQKNALPQLDRTSTTFEDDNINVGFLTWEHYSDSRVSALNNIHVCGEMIKAIALMDYLRPDPEDLKSFSYYYNLGKKLEEIRTIHFKVNNDRYLDAFTFFFPEIILHNDDEENLKDNYKVILEMLKKMYLGDDYQYVPTDSYDETDIEEEYIEANSDFDSEEDIDTEEETDIEI